MEEEEVKEGMEKVRAGVVKEGMVEEDGVVGGEGLFCFLSAKGGVCIVDVGR